MKNFLWVLLLLSFNLYAQEEAGLSGVISLGWSDQELALIIGVIIFTMFILVVEAFLISKSKEEWAPDFVLKIIGLTLILCFSILLLAARYDQDQTAPIFGLFGVIAGYLLGHESKK